MPLDLLLIVLTVSLTVLSALYSYDNTHLFDFIKPLTKRMDRFALITIASVVATVVYFVFPVLAWVYIAAAVAYLLIFAVVLVNWLRS